jgi:hypothetical protein
MECRLIRRSEAEGEVVSVVSFDISGVTTMVVAGEEGEGCLTVFKTPHLLCLSIDVIQEAMEDTVIGLAYDLGYESHYDAEAEDWCATDDDIRHAAHEPVCLAAQALRSLPDAPRHPLGLPSGCRGGGAEVAGLGAG